MPQWPRCPAAGTARPRERGRQGRGGFRRISWVVGGQKFREPVLDSFKAHAGAARTILLPGFIVRGRLRAAGRRPRNKGYVNPRATGPSLARSSQRFDAHAMPSQAGVATADKKLRNNQRASSHRHARRVAMSGFYRSMLPLAQELEELHAFAQTPLHHLRTAHHLPDNRRDLAAAEVEAPIE